jgi:hypothetical protein
MDQKQYLLYLSHSWQAEHVDLNIALWDHLWAGCRFLVDDNELENPPYFVSRIEDLIRRSDCFVAVAPPAPTDTSISPYVLFEIALAERAQLPRLVIVDRRIAVEDLLAPSPSLTVLRADFGELQSGSGDRTWNAVRAWLEQVTAAAPPKPHVASHRAAVLVSDGAAPDQMFDAIQTCLRQDGYTEVHDLRTLASDVDLLRRLRETDLLIADVGSMTVWDRYGLAHAAAVPTVRFAMSGAGLDGGALPAVLRGHARGYDRDVVRASSTAALVAAISAHARAIRLPRVVVDSREEGREYFERRRGLPARPPALS